MPVPFAISERILMVGIFQQAWQSPWIIAITIILFITGSITTFDIRLIQAKRHGALPAGHPLLPLWVAILYWVHYGLVIALFFMNWKYALILIVSLYVLKVLPVLETVGNMLMAPFKRAEDRIFTDIPISPEDEEKKQ